ncbi:hypothetical protein Bxe_C0200 [Paraburkholderia xenovorans LB400]|uniref:Uncharacterized protein n=1 Tax=Paraburkholderia xenovorans (strain LB400) TaxID=266265 RepID=Q13IG5_PARXL|nr:hypothetical protein Bxe_C0200 [Paraburkholderia xenovorans LB400]
MARERLITEKEAGALVERLAAQLLSSSHSLRASVCAIHQALLKPGCSIGCWTIFTRTEQISRIYLLEILHKFCQQCAAFLQLGSVKWEVLRAHCVCCLLAGNTSSLINLIQT